MPSKVSLPLVQDENPQVSELFKNFAEIGGTEEGDLRNFTFELRIDSGQPNVFMKKISGYAALGNDTGAYGTQAGGKYTTTAGVLKQFVVFDGAANSDIYENVGGTWTAAGRALTKNLDGYFVQFGSSLYFTNGSNAIQKYDGAAWSSLAVGNPYSGANTVAKYMIEFNNMLILARTSTLRNRLWISEVGTPETATVTFDFPDEITGLAKLGSFFVVCTATETYIMNATAPTNATRARKLSNIGCVSNRSMKEVDLGDGRKELWFVASDNSVRGFNGEVSRRIGYDDLRSWFPQLNRGSLSLAAATFYKGQYYLSVPYSSSTYNNKIYALDPRFNRWVRMDNFQAQFLDTYSSSGVEYLWFGEASLDGKVWTYPSGFTTQMPSASTAITFNYITANMDGGSPFLVKRFKKLYVQIKALGAVTFQIQSNIDELGYSGLRFGTDLSSYIDLSSNNPLWGSVIWGSFTWGGSNLVPTPDNRGLMTAKGKIIKYKFTDSQSTGQSEVYYFQHFYIPKKIR